MSSFLLLHHIVLVVERDSLQALQDHEHDDGQQRREDGAHQVVAAAVLADVHQASDDVTDHIHPRDGGREEETCRDGGGKGTCCCGYNAGHFTLSGEKRSVKSPGQKSSILDRCRHMG